nr:MAG TPA: hypothetical protein [Caudoviricetes sp.]
MDTVTKPLMLCISFPFSELHDDQIAHGLTGQTDDLRHAAGLGGRHLHPVGVDGHLVAHADGGGICRRHRQRGLELHVVLHRHAGHLPRLVGRTHTDVLRLRGAAAQRHLAAGHLQGFAHGEALIGRGRLILDRGRQPHLHTAQQKHTASSFLCSALGASLFLLKTTVGGVDLLVGGVGEKLPIGLRLLRCRHIPRRTGCRCRIGHVALSAGLIHARLTGRRHALSVDGLAVRHVIGVLHRQALFHIAAEGLARGHRQNVLHGMHVPAVQLADAVHRLPDRCLRLRADRAGLFADGRQLLPLGLLLQRTDLLGHDAVQHLRVHPRLLQGVLRILAAHGRLIGLEVRLRADRRPCVGVHLPAKHLRVGVVSGLLTLSLQFPLAAAVGLSPALLRALLGRRGTLSVVRRIVCAVFPAVSVPNARRGALCVLLCGCLCTAIGRSVLLPLRRLLRQLHAESLGIIPFGQFHGVILLSDFSALRAKRSFSAGPKRKCRRRRLSPCRQRRRQGLRGHLRLLCLLPVPVRRSFPLSRTVPFSAGAALAQGASTRWLPVLAMRPV